MGTAGCPAKFDLGAGGRGAGHEVGIAAAGVDLPVVPFAGEEEAELYDWGCHDGVEAFCAG